MSSNQPNRAILYFPFLLIVAAVIRTISLNPRRRRNFQNSFSSIHNHHTSTRRIRNKIVADSTAKAPNPIIQNTEKNQRGLEVVVEREESVTNLDIEKSMMLKGCDPNNPDYIDDDDQVEDEEVDRKRGRRMIDCNVSNNDKDNKFAKWFSNQQQQNENILPVSLKELQDNVHVHIRTKGRRDHKGCGGCMILWELYDHIAEMGISLTDQTYAIPKDKRERCPHEGFFDEQIKQNKTIVIVYPEVDGPVCDGPGRRVHVHWLLSPLGMIAREDRYKTWNEDDLVYVYSSGCSSLPHVPTSNVLQVIRSPEVNDQTDISREKFFDQSMRSGLMWLYRKAMPYKEHLKLVHNTIKGVENSMQIERPQIGDFFNYTYFFSYDPFSFYSYIAAMLGTISIVNPLENIPKEKWLEGTYVGEYYRANGGKVPGVAYGIDDEELEYAKRTMPELRKYLFKVKEWGQSTVPRFLRDSYRYGLGVRTNFEGGMFVRDAFPENNEKQSWIKEYMKSHEHEGYGKLARGKPVQPDQTHDRRLRGEAMIRQNINIPSFHRMQQTWLAEQNGFPSEMVDDI